MKSLLLLLLLMGVHGLLDAQESVSLDQRFRLHYNRWQSDQSPAAATTQASYDFNLGLPLVAYRLGALALTGSVDYDHLSVGGLTAGALGLNRYGLRATLFPYRPFHLSFDYSHGQSAGFAGQERVTGDVYGLGLNYRGRTVQDIELTARRGVNAQGAASEDWSLLKLLARQNIRGTRVSVEASHQAFGGSEFGARWVRSDLYATTETDLNHAWALRTNLAANEALGTRALSARLNLLGTPGRWNSMTSLSLDQFHGDAWASRSTLLSQTLALNTKRFSAFSSAALSSMQLPGGQGDAKRGTLLLGSTFNLGQGWRASVDFSESFGGGSQGTPIAPGQLGGLTSPQNIQTVHAGLSEGGDLPGIISRTLFFLTEQSFQRSVLEDYPPGYVPSELVAEMARRRFRQSGNLTFAGDLYHMQVQGGEGKADGARLTGQLRLNAGWTLQIIGDWKKDDGLSMRGTSLDTKVYTVNGAYHFGTSSSVVANAGYSKYSQTSRPGKDIPGQALLLNPYLNGTANRFVSLGFNSRLGLVPYGVQWSQYEDDWLPPTRALTVFLMVNIRKINMRVTYQSARRADGYRNDRISLDLLRWFDTISFGGFRP